MYTGELEHIINSHGLLSYCYTDDRQLSFFCNPGEPESLKSRVINCVDDVSNWMSSNRLKVNPTKTDFLWAATNRRQDLIPRGSITLSRVDIIPSRCVASWRLHRRRYELFNTDQRLVTLVSFIYDR